MSNVKIRSAALFLILATPCHADESTQADRPTRSEWEFEPLLMWQVYEAGDRQLDRPGELRVAADGTLFFHDFVQERSIVLDGDGNFVCTVAPRGSGPGEVSRYLNCFPGEEHMIIGAPDALHLFTPEGLFVAKYANNIFERFPCAFLTGRTFLCAPGQVVASPEGKMEILRVDLESGKDDVYAEISTAGAPEPRADGRVFTIRGLTPTVEIAFDRESQRVLYGRSDRYRIHVADLEGEEILAFGLDRGNRKVTEEEIREHMAPMGPPPQIVDEIVASSPERLTSFRRIQVIDGLIYVTASTGLSREPTEVQVDIFSAAGEYLHRAMIRFDESEHIFSSPDYLVIHEDSFYVALEGKDGRKSIARYAIALPN